MNIVMAVILVSFTLVTRWAPNTLNFSPVLAIALFAGSYYRGAWRFVVPLLAMFVSDIYLEFYPGMTVNYLAFALVVALGTLVKPQALHVFAGALAASVLFFVVSNFGVWMSAELYQPTWAGLLECYTQAIPFFRNTLVSTVCYSVLFFTIQALCQRTFNKDLISYARQK